MTLVTYARRLVVLSRCGMHPLANPVLIAVGADRSGAVCDAHVLRRRYFAGAQFVHFLLGPAVVGLAVPLGARTWASVRRLAVPIAGALDRRA